MSTPGWHFNYVGGVWAVDIRMGTLDLCGQSEMPFQLRKGGFDMYKLYMGTVDFQLTHQTKTPFIIVQDNSGRISSSTAITERSCVHDDIDHIWSLSHVFNSLLNL